MKARTFVLLLLSLFSFQALAQTATSSPYSKFGLGEIQKNHLPQFSGMGGLSTGIRSFDSYFNINTGNPASYSGLRLTVIDIGVYGNHGKMSRGKTSQTNSDFNLSHLNFAIPVSQKAAFSFGLMPFSTTGYRFSSPSTVDTISLNHVYSGDGGISKVYFGYGMQFGKHISVGFNANYLFGTLRNIQEVQYPVSQGALNAKSEQSRYINGLTFDYGVQYSKTLDNDMNFVIGYAGNVGTGMKVKESSVSYRTFGNSTGDNQNVALDTISYASGQKKDITFPLSHKVGFSLSKLNHWLVGIDGHSTKWSDYREGDASLGLRDSYGIAIGGVITPDITSTKYLNLVDYKMGIRYDKTNLRIGDKDVNEIAISLGFGLPLPSNRRTSFYKINFSTEFVQRGSSDVHLVKESFINFRLGFTLNDLWFQRYKYD